MEDIKAYIESGILELYVLGDITPDEKLQVEEMSLKHPAINAELTEIERSMEAFALQNAIEPDGLLRDKILNSLVTNFGDDTTFTTIGQPVKDNVIALPVSKPASVYKYAFAACLALLLLSVAALIDIYGKLQDANTRLVALNTTNQQYASTVNFKNEQLSIYNDTTTKFIRLKGTAKHNGASMLVAFNPAKKKVMIKMAGLNMPENDTAHQYQLWALVSGKPVSLGVFDKTGADSTDMKEMKSIALAQAFAVTLEPRGGSINPTMDNMMVIGSL